MKRVSILTLAFVLLSLTQALAFPYNFPSPNYIQVDEVKTSSTFESKYSPFNTLGSHWYFNKDLNPRSWIPLNHSWVPNEKQPIEWIEYTLSREETISQVAVEIEHFRKYRVAPTLLVELSNGQKHPLGIKNSNNPMTFSNMGKNIYRADFEPTKTKTIKIILDFTEEIKLTEDRGKKDDRLGISEVTITIDGIPSQLVPNTKKNKEFALKELSYFNLMIPEKGISIDFKTNYIWQDTEYTENSQLSFLGAEKYCPSLQLGNISSWKLPSVKELASLSHSDYDLKYLGSSYFTSSVDKEGNPIVFSHTSRTGGYEVYPLMDKIVDKHSVRCLKIQTAPIEALSAPYKNETANGTILWSSPKTYSPDLYRLRFLSLQEAFAFSLYIDSDKQELSNSNNQNNPSKTQKENITPNNHNNSNKPKSIELKKDEFETSAEFQKRKDEAEKERQKALEAWELKQREQNSPEALNEKKLKAMQRAVHITYGRPFLSLSYNADTEEYTAHIWSQFRDFETTTSFNIPRDLAKKFKEQITKRNSIPEIELRVEDGAISFVNIPYVAKFLEANKKVEKPKKEKAPRPAYTPAPAPQTRKSSSSDIDTSWFSSLFEGVGNWLVSLLPDSLGKSLLSFIGIPAWVIGVGLGVVLFAVVGILYVLNRKYVILAKLVLRVLGKGNNTH